MSATEQIREVLTSVLIWWEAKRPESWEQAQHLENPEVNCNTYEEKRLARAWAVTVRDTEKDIILEKT